MAARLFDANGSGGSSGGSKWSGPAPIWPYHEFQLSQISKEDGQEALGCRIVTSAAVAGQCVKLLTDNKIPCATDDSDPNVGSDDIVYVYLDRTHYQRTKYLIANKIRQPITPLPPELADLLELAKQAQATNPKLPPPPPTAPAPAAAPSASAASAGGGKRGDEKNEKNEKEKMEKGEGEQLVSPSEHVPLELWAKLKSYQRLSIYNFRRLSGRMYLADDPGLGKTLQAIVCASVYKAKWPVLVVCPSSVKSNWRNEFARWLSCANLTLKNIRIIESEADAVRCLPDPTDDDMKAANLAVAKIRAASAGSIKRKKPSKSTKPTAPANNNSTDASAAASAAVAAMGPLGPVREVDEAKRAADKVKRDKAKAARAVAAAKQALKPKVSYDVYIISYDLLIRPKVYSCVSAKRFKVLISDESHFLRNASSQRTICFMGLAHKAPHVLLLSGTPGHCPELMYAQIRTLQPNLFPPYWVPPPPAINTQEKWRAAETKLPCTYAGRWGDPNPEPTFHGKFQWALNSCARLNELNSILREFCLLKRTKDEVLKELPAKERHPIKFEVPLKERQIIEQELATMKGLRKTQPFKFKQKFMALYNDLPRIKMPGVKEYLTNLFAPGGEMGVDKTRKVLIFAHHKAMILAIEEIVRANEMGFIKITGETQTIKRQPLVDTFQNDPSVRVGILSITAAGFGLNLQAASLVVFTELMWSSDVLCQAEDRSHRLGQTAPVVICRYLLAKGTLDESLMKMVLRKTASSALMIEGRNATFAMKRAQRLALTTDEEPPETVNDQEFEDQTWQDNEDELAAEIESFQNQT